MNGDPSAPGSKTDPAAGDGSKTDPCAGCANVECICSDPVYVALKEERWGDVAPILARPGYVLPYAFLTSLCRIGTCAVERGFINTLLGFEPRVLASYGPFDFSLLHIALVFGNEYQLKTYKAGLTVDQFKTLCATKDARGMKPADLAQDILDSIEAQNYDRVKCYFPNESKDFWREFDFDCWFTDVSLFLRKLQ